MIHVHGTVHLVSQLALGIDDVINLKKKKSNWKYNGDIVTERTGMKPIILSNRSIRHFTK